MTDYLDNVLGKALSKDDDEDVDKDGVKRAAHEALDEAVKGRQYIDDPSEAPEDAEVHEGERGGLYFETEGGSESSGDFGDVEEAVASGEVESLTIDGVEYTLQEDPDLGTHFEADSGGVYTPIEVGARARMSSDVDIDSGGDEDGGGGEEFDVRESIESVDPEQVAQRAADKHPDDPGEALMDVALDMADTSWDEVSAENVEGSLEELLDSAEEVLGGN